VESELLLLAIVNVLSSWIKMAKPFNERLRLMCI